MVAEAIKNGDWSEKGLMPYEREWQDGLGKMHRRFYKIKEGVFHLDDDTLNRLAGAVNSLAPEKRTINGILTRALVSRPKLLLDLAKIVF